MELAPAHMQPAPAQPVEVMLITIAQAAQILSVSKQTIHNLINACELSPCKVTGTATRLWLDEIKAFATRRTRKIDARLGTHKV